MELQLFSLHLVEPLHPLDKRNILLVLDIRDVVLVDAGVEGALLELTDMRELLLALLLCP